MDPLSLEVAQRYINRTARYEPDTAETETITAGIALLIAQSVVVSNQFFDEKEIKKFLALRRSFHGPFTDACAKLADDFEAGKFGSSLISAANALRAVSRTTVTQDRQALVQVTRILRGMSMSDADISPIVLRLIRQIRMLETDAEQRKFSNDYTEFFKNVIKLEVVPTPMKTLLRKVVQLGRGSSKELSLKPHVDENPGAWFEMTSEQQSEIRKTIEDAEKIIRSDMDDKTPEERQVVWAQARESLVKAQRSAGVHLNIIKREADRPSIDALLKKEEKMEMDGAAQFVAQKVIQSFAQSARWKAAPGFKTPKEDAPLPREAGKFVTLLRKAKTLDTVKIIVQEAIEKGVVGPTLLEDLKGTFDEVTKNKAVKDGVPLVPLHFKPMSVEEFQEAHNTGPVELPEDMSEKEQKELLGRVSRAVSDLEGIFGKGFCGKHGKKLAFRFGGSTNFMASAHYFAWDDRDRSGQRVWQPRVTFGEDYEGLLAHELSHYFEDLIAFRLEKKEMESKGETGDPRFGGSGSIFGGGTADSFAESFVESTYTGRGFRNLKEFLPEAFDLMAAVTRTPDYARWEDKLSSAYETALPRAVKNLTGIGMYDLPKDHAYYGAERARYKSQLPPELVKEMERVYSQLTDGDTRKLTYLQSSAEVWARMCEQYVYTKLSKSGVVNPWLTKLTYDDDVYVEQDRFQKEIEPIFDRLFSRLGAKNILARLLRRLATARRA